MSSGFVPAGSEHSSSRNDDDWLRAQHAIEATRRQKREEGKQEGGKSLYEVLQQNKTAKQEAFEESTRLKNQYRTLDSDEVDFLDGILESTRAKEREVQKETAEQLEAFRKQREAVERALAAGDVAAENVVSDALSPTGEELWAPSSRKRRRKKEKNDDVSITKLRKTASTLPDPPQTSLPADAGLSSLEPIQTASNENFRQRKGTAKPTPKPIDPPSNALQAPQTHPPVLGLAAYSSDED